MLGLFLGLLRIKQKITAAVAGTALTDNLSATITDSAGNPITGS